jgi:hypothetical protein
MRFCTTFCTSQAGIITYAPASVLYVYALQTHVFGEHSAVGVCSLGPCQVHGGCTLSARPCCQPVLTRFALSKAQFDAGYLGVGGQWG